MAKWVSPSGTVKDFEDNPANVKALEAAGYTRQVAKKKAPKKAK